MAAPKRYEQQFLDALTEIFVGAPVEGASGYINLMKIKASYFEAGVYPQLMKDIEIVCRGFAPAFREELFDKLHDFFKRYFSESGSIYFRHTPLHNNVYEKVYTDDRDVMLFWKTHMLYYVKTDRLFQSMALTVDAIDFQFDVSALEHKRANEKRELMYAFQAYRNGKIVLNVTYSEKGRKTKADEILRAIKEKGFAVAEATLERACRLFEKQSEVDYFINKNAKAFLQEQFDLWFYQYVFSGESAWTEKRLQQLQAIKTIAYRIIAFIAQFEDELVRIWNKPKFVRNSHYIITLDKISDADLRRRLYAHPGMTHQLAEWQTLGMVDAAFELTLLTATDLVGQPRHPHYQYLPLDTRYFPDLELAILALFDDLDAALDGWLIHSENYQALNTLLPKFRNKVQAIYADPPYNTNASEIIYANDYKDSSWLTLLENRLEIAKLLLSQDGLMCVTIDDYEVHRLRAMVDNLSRLEVVGTVAIKNSPSGRPTVRGFRINHEYALFMASDKGIEIGQLDKSQEQMALYKETDIKGTYQWANLRKRGGANTLRVARPKQFYPFYVAGDKIRIPRMKWSKEQNDWIILDARQDNEIILYPIGDDGKERIWSLGHETARTQIDDLEVRRKNDNVSIFRKLYLTTTGSLPSTWWDNTKYFTVEHGTGLLENILGSYQAFSFPKSVYAVEDCLRVAGVSKNEDALILDFFGGSGTTAHAVINLNRVDEGGRKYILVEMGEHFNTVILPRIKKVVFSGKWKDGKAVLNNGDGEGSGKGISHFAKYYQLEQYEETLRRARYDDAPLLAGADAYNAYVFLRDLKLLEAVRLDKAGNKVQVNLTTLYDGIDLAETLSCVTGKGIKRITQESVEFQDGTSASLTDPDWQLVKPLIWW
jgi:adenine-specific DNA-methyltransferase